eukprot:1207797-Prymnesium_polylepis.1
MESYLIRLFTFERKRSVHQSSSMPHHSYRITPSALLNAETHVILENHDVLGIPSKSLLGGFIHP